jgi:hypothetical protein
MISRWQERVAAAERRRYGVGLPALVRRLLAGDVAWRSVRRGVFMFVLAHVPRRLLVAVTAVMLAWLLAGVLVLVALAQLLA